MIPSRSFTLATVTFYVLLTLAAMGAALLSPAIELRLLPAGGAWEPWALGLGAAVVAVLFSVAAVRRWAWARHLAERFEPILGSLSVWETLVVAASSAVGEEFLFRGVLVPLLGVPASSLLFAFLHGFFLPAYLGWSLFALALGWFWGMMVADSGALLPVVLSHLAINFVNIRLLPLRPGKAT
jgi:membrane protease YdiL (CAAX protease family)